MKLIIVINNNNNNNVNFSFLNNNNNNNGLTNRQIKEQYSINSPPQHQHRIKNNLNRKMSIISENHQRKGHHTGIHILNQEYNNVPE